MWIALWQERSEACEGERHAFTYVVAILRGERRGQARGAYWGRPAHSSSSRYRFRIAAASSVPFHPWTSLTLSSSSL